MNNITPMRQCESVAPTPPTPFIQFKPVNFRGVGVRITQEQFDEVLQRQIKNYWIFHIGTDVYTRLVKIELHSNVLIPVVRSNMANGLPQPVKERRFI